LAATFAEDAGKSFGLGESERYSLRLSAEDILAYLCPLVGPGQHVEIEVRYDVYHIALRFWCRPERIDMRVLNLTAKSPIEGGIATRDLELFTVSRMVDRLWVTWEPDGRMSLSVVIDRVYAEKTQPLYGDVPPAANWSIVPAGRETIQLAAGLAVAHYPESQYPAFLRFPRKAADVIASGDWQTALATGAGGDVFGGVLWTWRSPKMIEMSGPLLFPPSQPAAVEAALVEHVIQWAAKTPAVGISCRRRGPRSVPAGFEALGTIASPAGAGLVAVETFSYRGMHEDTGASVFCHPAVEEFLRREYARLVLPRRLHAIPFEGTEAAESSVLTCDFNAGGSEVLLRAMTFGTDAPENLREHLTMLRGRGTTIVLFEMDLGVPWQSAFAPVLLDAGFSPRMVVPYAGTADIVLFQHISEA
jgi:hypothetical protein